MTRCVRTPKPAIERDVLDDIVGQVERIVAAKAAHRAKCDVTQMRATGVLDERYTTEYDIVRHRERLTARYRRQIVRAVIEAIQ